MLIAVDVTWSDIRQGQPLHDRCPLALAIRRATGGCDVLVTHDRVLVGREGERAQVYALPAAAAAWSHTWNISGSGRPMRFYLEPLE